MYVDDFLLMPRFLAQRRRVMRASLTAIDEVFRLLSPTDPVHCKEPASVKKMLQGIGLWSTTKRILGWDLDIRASTLNLPPHRLDRLYELLDLISPPQRCVSVKCWQQLLGERRSMSPALPGAQGLFLILQDSLGKADRHHVRLTNEVWHMAANFRATVDSLRSRPTRLQELMPANPSLGGACDACLNDIGCI